MDLKTKKNRRTIGEKHSKNSKNTTRRTTSAIWRIFEELNNPLSPNLVDKQAIEDELNVNGSKHVLASQLGIILNEIRTIIDFGISVQTRGFYTKNVLICKAVSMLIRLNKYATCKYNLCSRLLI